MQDSRFRALVEEEIKKQGTYDVLAGSEFSVLVKKTVIERLQRGRVRYTWCSGDDEILAECTTTKDEESALPKLGKIKYESKRNEYQNAYAKNTLTQFNLRFTAHDADVIEALKAQPNKQAYIKELIRKDIKERGRE